MKTLLLTGFGLWGHENYNSSWEILQDNTLALPEGWRARIERLPVSWTAAPARLDELLRDDSLRAVVCFGMCGGRTVGVERIAINLTNADLADADGKPPPSEFVVPGAPPAYWSGLPVAAILASLASARVPAAESRNAGGFLCNFAFFHLMHRLAARAGPHVVGGFVHVPHFETEGGLLLELLRLAVPVITGEVARAAERDR